MGDNILVVHAFGPTATIRAVARDMVDELVSKLGNWSVRNAILKHDREPPEDLTPKRHGD